LFVQLGKLLELRRQIWGWRHRSRILLFFIRLFLVLLLLVLLLLVLLLLLGVLLRISLILVMADRAGGAGNDCRTDRSSSYTSSSYDSSGSHINLLIYFL
jgi:hypothetical protein